FFWAEKKLRAVEMRPKFHTVRLDLSDFREAENLEPTAIRQNRQRPVHKPMQAASLADDLHPRSDIQVIRVAENDLRPHLAQLARVERFDARLRADRHEHRCFDDTARRINAPKSRLR